MSYRQTDIRLAELVATLSLGTDLGLGQPMEHVMRETRIALRMGDLLGLDQAERTVAYYSGLLAWVESTRTPTSRPSGSATISPSRPKRAASPIPAPWI